MLRLCFSPLRQLGTDCIMQTVCDNAAQGIARQILIVPEQASFDTERRLCELGGDSIPRFAEVLSFTRLASRVFSTVGGTAIQTLDKSGRLIAMAGALEQVRSRLKIYGTCITKPDFLLQLLQISDEFKNYGVSAAAVRRVFPTLTGTLAEKMEELSLILEAYDTVCTGAKLDPASRLDLLCNALAESDYAEGRAVFIDGFSDFTAQELQVICELMRSAASVTVFLCCDDLHDGQSVFSVTRGTARSLIRMAQSYGVAVEHRLLSDTDAASALAHLRRHLFAAKLPEWADPTDTVCLSDAGTAFDECLHAVADIQELLLRGARLREIGIACTDAAYLPMLETLFARYQIPCYLSDTQDVLQKSALRGVLAALRAAACGMEYEDVADYLDTGIAPVSADECDRLKNYAFLWNIHGSVWEKEFTFSPLGYDGDEPAHTEALLQALNSARAAAVEPLVTFRSELTAAKNTAQQVLALHRFLERIGLRETLSTLAGRRAEQHELAEAQEYSQLYDILSDTMEQIYGVLGESVRTPEDFYRFFRATLSQHTVGTIPATLDCVCAGTLPEMRNRRIRHLLVLGASDGLLPSGAPTAGLLSDRERKVLADAGLMLAPDASARLERELLNAYLVLTAPADTLYISCTAGAASYLYQRIEQLFPHCRRFTGAPMPVTALQAAGDALRRQAELPEQGEVRQQAEALRQRAGYEPGTLSQGSVTALYGEKIRLSASKIDRFAQCRYAFFLQYGLQAKECRQATIDASIFGTFVHDVLEKTSRQVMAEGGFHTVTEERLNELAAQYIDEFVNERLNGLADKSARQIAIFRSNLEEVRFVVRELWEELKQSDYVPEGFEIGFFGDAAVGISGKNAESIIVGKVDRADLFRDNGRTYLRIVDYKTGTKTFDYTDILTGVGLQMLIYLFAMQMQAKKRFGSEVIPAGVLYFPARMPHVSAPSRMTEEKVEKERRSSLRRKGLLLEDDRSLCAMEPEPEHGAMKYLPYQIMKSGERSGPLADSTQMEQLRSYVFRTLADLTDELFAGNVAPNPYMRGDYGICTYCPYTAVCHRSSGDIPVRNLKATGREQFWSILEKEAEAHG